MWLEYRKILLLLSVYMVFVCALYDFRFETFQQLAGDTETLVEFKLRLLGRERLINGTIIFHTDVDDEFLWQIRLEQDRNGEWKHLNLNLQNTTCPFYEYFYRHYWESSIVDSNLPKGKDACPIRKGEYYLKNVAMSSDSWLRYVKQGMIKCQLTISKNNIMYGGFVGVAVLTEVST